MKYIDTNFRTANFSSNPHETPEQRDKIIVSPRLLFMKNRFENETKRMFRRIYVVSIISFIILLIKNSCTHVNRRLDFVNDVA